MTDAEKWLSKIVGQAKGTVTMPPTLIPSGYAAYHASAVLRLADMVWWRADTLSENAHCDPAQAIKHAYNATKAHHD